MRKHRADILKHTIQVFLRAKWLTRKCEMPATETQLFSSSEASSCENDFRKTKNRVIIHSICKPNRQKRHFHMMALYFSVGTNQCDNTQGFADEGSPLAIKTSYDAQLNSDDYRPAQKQDVNTVIGLTAPSLSTGFRHATSDHPDASSAGYTDLNTVLNHRADEFMLDLTLVIGPLSGLRPATSKQDVNTVIGLTAPSLSTGFRQATSDHPDASSAGYTDLNTVLNHRADEFMLDLTLVIGPLSGLRPAMSDSMAVRHRKGAKAQRFSTNSLDNEPGTLDGFQNKKMPFVPQDSSRCWPYRTPVLFKHGGETLDRCLPNVFASIRTERPFQSIGDSMAVRHRKGAKAQRFSTNSLDNEPGTLDGFQNKKMPFVPQDSSRCWPYRTPVLFKHGGETLDRCLPNVFASIRTERPFQSIGIDLTNDSTPAAKLDAVLHNMSDFLSGKKGLRLIDRAETFYKQDVNTVIGLTAPSLSTGFRQATSDHPDASSAGYTDLNTVLNHRADEFMLDLTLVIGPLSGLRPAMSKQDVNTVIGLTAPSLSTGFRQATSDHPDASSAGYTDLNTVLNHRADEFMLDLTLVIGPLSGLRPATS
ncbi:hypothetical protein CLF_106934, partial [Clonorchis sinensis]